MAKYIALRDLGFDMERIKFVNGIFDYTKGGAKPEDAIDAHVSVMYQADGKELLLDNKPTRDLSGKVINNPAIFDLSDQGYLKQENRDISYIGMYDPVTNIIVERRGSENISDSMPLNMDKMEFSVSKTLPSL